MRRASAGFTLLEMMIVVVVIGILAGLTAVTFTRQSARVEVRQSARRFRSLLNRARVLSMAASAHVGGPTFQDCNGNPELRITVNPGAGTYQIPVALRFANGGATMVADCETVDVVTQSNGQAQLVTNPPGVQMFAFTGSGRLDPQFQTPVFVRFERVEAGVVQDGDLALGIRILPSGVVCGAADPNNTGCVEDPP